MDALLVLTAVAAILPYLRQTWGLLLLGLQVGTNDSAFAAESFIKLINAADRTMLICDDGNKMEGSLYENQMVVAAIQVRLQTNEALRLYCLFSSEDQTLFRERLEGHERVIVKVVRPRRQIHFKIIDGGQQGYVSSHPPGAHERQYRLYDCTRTPRSLREQIFGRHIRGMQDVFPETAVA